VTNRPRSRADPLEREIERALSPGAFIAEHSCDDFVSGLDGVSVRIDELIDTEPARAVVLYETFLAGCFEKADEVDDSSGDFGQYVHELFAGWISARQADGADPDTTAARLLSWMDDDSYGFCYRLEKDIATVLDKAGRAAFVTLIRSRFDGASKMKQAANRGLTDNPEYARRRWGETLRALYSAQRDVPAYIALAKETGLTAQDCHAIATLLATRRQPEEALSWVNRGMALDRKEPNGSSAGYDLAKLKRRLLIKLGRGREALDDAWADFRENPSTYSYDDLMKLVPKADRPAWHRKAIAAVTGASLRSHMELLLETREMERLAGLVRQCDDSALEGLSHFTSGPVAAKLEKSSPDSSARLWRAQGMRILNAKKSKYYDAALLNFESAKRCFDRAGLASEWEKTVSKVRTDHFRKKGFLSGFERLAAGIGPSDEPSFLERAKARWTERKGGENA
jgi:tetratricopeptide (TPR) repeat protein